MLENYNEKKSFCFQISSVIPDNGKYYKLEQNDMNNFFVYEDENIFLTSRLPHLIGNHFGGFYLDFKVKGVSICPTDEQIFELIKSDKSIESIIFLHNYGGHFTIRLWSYSFSLNSYEYKSFCDALRLYVYFFKKNYNLLLKDLGVEYFEKKQLNSDYYLLGYINRDLWNKLIELSYKHDLDIEDNNFERFNANKNQLIMYNSDIHSGYNIKMWVTSIFEEDKQSAYVKLYWRCPSELDCRLIKNKMIFTAKESFDFINNEMISRLERKQKRFLFFFNKKK